jgi:outer membrane autotransporter protein
VTLADGGRFIANGGFTLGATAGGTAVLNIGGAEGGPATAAGELQAASAAFGPGIGRINFNHTDGAYQFAPVISGNGAVNHTGPGTTILTGTNTYTGTTTISAGTLAITQDASLGDASGTLVFNGGTLRFDAGFDLSAARAISITASGGAINTNGFATTIAQGITGAGGLAVTGGGTLILTGTNSYAGGTVISQGTLAIAADSAVGAATGSLTFDGGTLRFDAGFDLSASRPIAITASGGAIDTNGFAPTIGSGIAGAGGLTVTGGGTLILTGANTYAGGTAITAGTALQLGNGGTSGSIQGDVLNNGTLTFNRSDSTRFAGTIAGSGALIVTGGGTVILTGENSYTGGTTITAGTLQIGDGGTTGSIIGDIRNDSPHTLVFNRSNTLLFPGVISGIGAVRQEGTGTTVLTGDSTYTGGTTIAAGTLQLGNGGTSGSIVGDVLNNGTLAFNRADTLTFSGVVSGTGGVRQDGSGVTVLSGANTYAGPTAVNAGVLRAGAAGAFSAASAVTVASGATLDLAGLDQAVGGLANAGLVSLGGAPGTRLTVAGNLVGQGGAVALNTVLGGDGSASDRLVISGGTATGDTRLRIASAGGAGAQTVEGIQVVQVANGGTTAAGAFRLDTRVAAGAYEYQLFRGGNASADDWYLRSFLLATPASPETPATPASPGIPLYRPEVALYAPIAAIGRQMGLATLGTLHERVGEEENIRDLAGASPYANGAWARAFGQRTRNRWDGGPEASAVGNLIGLQAGFDILRTNPYAGGHRDHAGVYVAYTDYNAPNVSGFAVGQQQRVGRLLMSGPTVGAYWTHFGPSGWYVDAVFQANWFDVKASSDFGTALNTNGTGYTASLEAGYPIRFGQAGRWQIEPQAQIIWQSVSVDRSRDLFSSVDWDEDDAVTGRLGARLQYTARDERTLWQPYAKVNLWHAFSGTDRVSFGSSAPIENRFGDTAIEVGAGITARVNQTTSFYAHADYRWSVDGGRSRQTATQGAIGIRFNW